MASPDPDLLIPEEFMHTYRQVIAAGFDDVLAVLVLRGSPERGLALSASARPDLTEDEAIELLHAALEG